MNMTRRTEPVEIVMTDQRRRRWSVQEKAALVRRTYEPGMSVSLVARQEGVAASLLFQWRRLEREGALVAVSAGDRWCRRGGWPRHAQRLPSCNASSARRPLRTIFSRRP